jgi:hypothetical protein
MVARFIAGTYCGLFSGVLPLYLSELPPFNYCGLTGGLFQLMVVLGVLTTSVYGLEDVLGCESLWPILAGAFLYLPCIAMLGLFFAVESPKHLYINKNDKKGAQEALVKLRGVQSANLMIEKELEMFEKEKAAKLEQLKIGYADLFIDKSLRHPLIIGMTVHLAQQLCGVNVVRII